jgi:hypothetical protein
MEAAASKSVCFFCEEPEHANPRCPHLNRLLSAESIHINSGGIFLGPRREGAMPIWKLPGISLLQTVERQVNMRESSGKRPAALTSFNMTSRNCSLHL